MRAPLQLRMDIRRRLEALQIPRGLWAKRLVLFSIRPATVYAVAATLMLALVGAWTGGMSYQSGKTATPESPRTLTVSNMAPIQLMAQVRQTVVGQIVCLGCELEALNITDEHQIGLRTEDGSLWRFVRSQSVEELMADRNNVTHQVRITGTLFNNARFIDVEDYTVI